MAKLFSFYRTVLFSVIAIYILVAVAPLAFGYKSYIILSGSMEPEIQTGAICFVSKNDDYDVGTVIGYRLNDEITVVHRIIEIQEEDGQIVTKGDANESADIATVSPSQVVGVVKWSVPYIGFITQWMQTKSGIIICVTLVSVALISSFLTDIAETRSEKKKALSAESENEQSEKSDDK